MQRIVSFEIAKFLFSIGYKEQTDFLYLNTKRGIRAVVSDLNGKISVEKVFYEGSLEKTDEQYGITYPSAHWIPAPFVFDAIKFIDDVYNIRIMPYYDNGYIYNFIIPEDLAILDSIDKHYHSQNLNFNPTISHSIEICYENALKDFMKLIKEKQIKIEINS